MEFLKRIGTDLDGRKNKGLELILSPVLTGGVPKGKCKVSLYY
jgi:hypothetical protein